MKKVGIAILGLGVVGGGVYKTLLSHRTFYQATQNVDLVVEQVLESNHARVEELEVPEEKLASCIAEIVYNPDVNIVVECIGGVEQAREYALAALNAGKSLVTSNKELISKFYHELERAAKRHNAALYFEASCAGGVPVIRTILDGVQSNHITSIVGIINGTTNYVLSRMTEEGKGYGEALEEARRLGYAEADPTADVEGFDAAYKLSILTSLAFHTKVPYTKVFREGISTITAEDIAEGAALGMTLKLLAIGKNGPDGIEVRVHPAFVSNEHPLASVNGSFNAVVITGDAVGEIMLYGKGAGEMPTASAVVSDILYAATHSEIRYSTFKNTAAPDKDVNFVTDFTSAYYLRIAISDEAGVLGKIATILGRGNISIRRTTQVAEEDGKATLILVTHETREHALKNAVQRINATGVAKVEQVLRVAL